MNQPPTSLILFSAPATYNCIIFDPECWPNAGHWPAATCGDKWKGKCGVEGGELLISPQPILTLVVTVHQHSNQSLAVFVTTTKFCTPSCSLQLQTSSTSSEFSYFTEHNRWEGAAIKHKKDESELFITQSTSHPQVHPILFSTSIFNAFSGQYQAGYKLRGLTKSRSGRKL